MNINIDLVVLIILEIVLFYFMIKDIINESDSLRPILILLMAVILFVTYLTK